ncbi:MAG: DNA (cytosine-5-)-methyltransferase [Oceanospirillaceae bacterium]|nr:DNA (cytosine-5-)-methyltransferase [Oceanospirillaceae bacterium]
MGTNKITFNSFFAGIGGFDLGFENSGLTPLLQCEINPFCQDVLKKHWPKVQLFDDITTIKPNEIPLANIWCGGFPCQDVSVARGSKGRQGLKGKNSGLFFPFFQLITEHQPEIVLLENVMGLLSSHNGQDFRTILESFNNQGYSVAWRVMNSRFFGAPQSRTRVFICASKNQPLLAMKTLFETEGGPKLKNLRKAFLDVSECSKSGAKVAQIAYCLAATSGRHTGTDWSRTYVSYQSKVRRLIPLECEGIQGFPKHWTDLDPNTTSDIDSDRYHALGNAVSVPVTQWIAKRLKKHFTNASDIEPLPSDFTNYIINNFGDAANSPRVQNLDELHFDVTDKANKLKWLNGGFIHNGICIDFKASDAPMKVVSKKLIDVIYPEKVDSKYYLSSNAAKGILRRVYSQNRKLFAPMHDALVQLSSTTDNVT